MNTPTNLILVLGRSGAGKDEQAARMQQRIPDSGVVSPGQSLRQLRAGNDRYNTFLLKDAIMQKMATMDKGKLFPGDLIVGLTRFEVEQNISEGKKTVLITGVPFNQDQMRAFDEWMTSTQGEYTTTYVLYEASQEIAEKRINGRIDEGRRRGVVRSDDENNEARRERQRVFTEEASPVLAELQRRGVLNVINADGARDEVEHETRELLEQLQLVPREIEPWQKPSEIEPWQNPMLFRI